MDGGATGRYCATPENFHITVAQAARTRRSVYRRVARSAADFVLYTVGEEQCDQVDGSQYCNGPLPEDKSFVVIIWACTRAGCTESADVVIVRTQAVDDGLPMGAIIGAVAAVVVVIIIAAVIIVLVLRRRKSPGSSSVQLSLIRKPIKLKDFATHLERLHKDYNRLFHKEFKTIEKISPEHSQEAAMTDANKLKNRYAKTLSYDHSRVKLSTGDDDAGTTDYINANYIPGYNSPREYIATQGPMVSTFSDFWRMMWEQKSSLIVMLSDLQERGEPKVDMYWPGELHAPLQYGDIIVELTTSSTLNKFTTRTFRLHKEDQDDMRRVVQYFVPGWEVFSANLQSEEVLDFISIVRQEARSSQGPVVVHCSAGVGRTGTFIALDFLKQFVEEHSLDDEVDIFTLVRNLRHYRPLMVQSESQYVFIHDTLKVIIERKVCGVQERNIYFGISPNVNQASDSNGNAHVYTDLRQTTKI
ncbi:receptor-type tyrosine-protein phosphatase O-like isoform X2 [Babylonia areolata]|uniref:receptor-type tyrosine-protein phosphatase O-like isoform X2 n=1 Tax=Babylonia areolata TaxID=304850 RepID=UPI003FD3CF71